MFWMQMSQNKIKVIARYLPQYHEVEENNNWHWKWFTERTNVKMAKPLYRWHIQPKIPYKYYDLLSPDIRKEQWELAKKHGIYWFCYYHYRFEGRMLLEKPLEKLLEDWYPDINFCLSWANHSWTRKWWGQGEDQILLKQTYWLEHDRESHFNYLLKLFKHKNYILINNKPLFIIYNLKEITSYDEMIHYRNLKCKENGFDGIYILETLNSFNNKKASSYTDGTVQFEPLLSLSAKNMPYIYLLLSWIKLTLNKYLWFSFVHTFKYHKIWRKVLSFKASKLRNWEKCYFWWFANRDNTARKGLKWYIITSASPQKFKIFFEKLVRKSQKHKNEFVFLNAWNERAEWCYLEPDRENWDAYLKTIKKIVDSSI